MTKDKETRHEDYFCSDESTVSSRSSILKKKLQAEKLALELKIAKQQCKEEIQLMCAEALQRKKPLEMKKKAEESNLEYEYEDAIAKNAYQIIRRKMIKS